ERVHAHGALAGIELAYAGMNGSNLYTREIPLAPSHTPIITYYADPVQARAMDKDDIRNLRRWYVNAALRARRMEYDLVCLYAAHGFGAPQHFLSRRYNRRTDEYGGSLANRGAAAARDHRGREGCGRLPLRGQRARQHRRAAGAGGDASRGDARGH